MNFRTLGIALVLSCFFMGAVVAPEIAFAQPDVAALSGDSLCGKDTPCTFADLGKVIRNALGFLVAIAVAFIVVMVMYTAVLVALAQDKAGALKEAKDRIGRLIAGLVIITVIASISAYLILLESVGVQGSVLDFIRALFTAPTAMLQSFIATPVFAEEVASTLPSPLGVTNLYAFLLMIIRFLVLWFIMPAIIVAWLYTGVLFVFAQGNPQQLQKAKEWLWWVLVATVIIMVAEAAAFALRDTITQIFS